MGTGDGADGGSGHSDGDERAAAAATARVRVSYISILFFFDFLFFPAGDISTRTRIFSRAGEPPARKNSDFHRRFAPYGLKLRT
jgi:hypothetical protein